MSAMIEASLKLHKVLETIKVDFPRFYRALNKCAVQFTEEVPRVTIDNQVLKLNPQWILDTGMHEMRDALLHDALHLLLCHPQRYQKVARWIRGAKAGELFNVAADLEANCQLDDQGLVLPPHFLLPGIQYEDYDLRAMPWGRTAEEYFGLLLRQAVENGGLAPPGSPSDESDCCLEGVDSTENKA